jgi:hypothetical protein
MIYQLTVLQARETGIGAIFVEGCTALIFVYGCVIQQSMRPSLKGAEYNFPSPALPPGP